MYLSARKYVGNYEHCAESEKKSYADILKAAGVGGMVSHAWAPHLSVEVCVAYWRKANAIHRWFVSRCQNGVDNCLEHHVSREQIEELWRECEEALASRGTQEGAKRAEERLPTGSGPFFGDTDFGDDYWYSLGDTAAQIRRILDNKSLEELEFSYRSSW